MRKWLQLLLVAVGSVCILAACSDGDDSEASGSESDGGSDDAYVIGATQILEHPSLDEA